VVHAVTQLEFNSIWHPVPGIDFELPACDEGMILLKKWADNDPAMAQRLPDVPKTGSGDLAQNFYRHLLDCPKCNEL
jgi:hypothetical protein